jgi:hypothetical protein
VVLKVQLPFDDTELFRQQELVESRDFEQEHPLEVEASMYGLNSIKAISERVLQRIDALIGSNSASVAWYDSKTFAPKMLVENVGPEYQKLLPTAWALRHEHPGIRYHYVHRGRAVAIADLVPLYQWKKTGLYNEVFSKLGMQEQLGASFPFAFPDLCGVVVHRTRRTFT